MGTYISHFRSTELLLKEIKGLDDESFLYGNLAPDSGIPNEDWTAYYPPRIVTHFLPSANSDETIQDMEFYKRYLKDLTISNDKGRFSFLLGYFIHLICDNLWSLWIVVPTEKYYEALIRERGAQAWEIIKQDWHDLDRKYFYEHPNLKIWRFIKLSKNKTKYLPFLPSGATLQQLDYIENVYLPLKESSDLERSYPYLNETVMDRFIDESTQVVLEILAQQDRLRQCDDHTALSLLDPEKLLPYEYPLGDVL